MQNKLSALPAPALAGVVKEKTVRGANAAIRNCRLDGADMIDLHLSCLENTDVETIARIVKASALPILALHYNDTYDRQPAGVPEEARVACLLRAVKAGVAGIDMQGYTFDPQSKDGFRGEDHVLMTMFSTSACSRSGVISLASASTSARMSLPSPTPAGKRNAAQSSRAPVLFKIWMSK